MYSRFFCFRVWAIGFYSFPFTALVYFFPELSYAFFTEVAPNRGLLSEQLGMIAIN